MILLDTCSLLWLSSDPDRFSDRARSLVIEFKDHLHASAASAWEMALKKRKGKLDFPLPVLDWFGQTLDRHGILEIPVSSSIAVKSAELPFLHSDPVDRILIATAFEKNLILLTPDRLISQYPGIRCEW